MRIKFVKTYNWVFKDFWMLVNVNLEEVWLDNDFDIFICIYLLDILNEVCCKFVCACHDHEHVKDLSLEVIVDVLCKLAHTRFNHAAWQDNTINIVL